MTTFQFIVSGCTGLETGKKQKMKKGTRKINAMMLIGTPALPKDQRDDGSCSRLRRFESIQPIERIYDARSADSVMETIALRAAEEPRLSRLIRTPHAKETTTALRGIG